MMTAEDEFGAKANWPAGPWHQEPDRLEWRFRGVPCLILRGPTGAWCGYAGVYADHPWFQEHYDDVDVNVHGGPTFADHCTEHICHVPREDDRGSVVWWIGFDCAHAGDIVPGMLAVMQMARKMMPPSPFGRLAEQMRTALDDADLTEADRALSHLFWRESYKDMQYVRREVTRLAIQILRAETVKGRIRRRCGQIGRLVSRSYWDLRSHFREVIRDATRPPEPLPSWADPDKMFALDLSFRKRRELRG